MATAVSLKLSFPLGVVDRVGVLWVVSQGPVTHAHAHKQGFGPLEKITLIITGCIWTCPQREGEGSGRRQGLTEKEKERERATSAGAFLHAVSRSDSVQSFLLVCMEISKRWKVTGS